MIDILSFVFESVCVCSCSYSYSIFIFSFSCKEYECDGINIFEDIFELDIGEDDNDDTDDNDCGGEGDGVFDLLKKHLCMFMLSCFLCIELFLLMLMSTIIFSVIRLITKKIYLIKKER